MKLPLTYHSESELLRHFAAGQADAFTSVYRQYHFRVYEYAKRWLPERQDAEDVTADSFVKLWDRKTTFETLDNIAAFLFVTVRNACFDFLRHQQVKMDKQEELLRRFNEAKETDFNVQETREDFLKLVYAEVDKMPPKMKEIFLLSYRDGLKPAEIARKLDLSVQTISNQKTNAINLLKLAFSDKPLLVAFLLYLETQVI